MDKSSSLNFQLFSIWKFITYFSCSVITIFIDKVEPTGISPGFIASKDIFNELLFQHLGLILTFLIKDFSLDLSSSIIFFSCFIDSTSKCCFKFSAVFQMKGLFYYCSVQSYWVFFIKMRAPSFLHKSREDGGKKGSSHFDKNSNFDRTSQYSFVSFGRKLQ